MAATTCLIFGLVSVFGKHSTGRASLHITGCRTQNTSTACAIHRLMMKALGSCRDDSEGRHLLRAGAFIRHEKNVWTADCHRKEKKKRSDVFGAVY